MKLRRATNISGFTLLEVLVSTVLLASVFVSVVGLSSQSLRNLNRLHPHEIALSHAREKMNELLLVEELQPGVTSGYWDDGYRWEVRVSPSLYNPRSTLPGNGLFEIRVVIAWGDAPAGKTYVLETTQWAKGVASNARQ